MPATGSRTAIIGAGLAGVTCGRRLLEVGHDVTIFEKSRGIGGRAATRRSEAGTTFDHGAQYFTVRDPLFLEDVEHLAVAGLVQEWPVELMQFNSQAWQPEEAGAKKLVGSPRMPLFVRELAGELDVRLECQIGRLWRDENGWILHEQAGSQWGPFDALVLAVPAPQAVALLQDYLPIRAQLDHVQMDPCWAVMVETPISGLPHDAGFIADHPVAWFARNNSKPGRPQKEGHESWVLHASGDWTRDHLEDDAARVADGLWKDFAGTVGVDAQPVWLTAHRWRYARVVRALGQTHIWDADLALGLCGDWCIDARVEAAWLSGSSLAKEIA